VTEQVKVLVGSCQEQFNGLPASQHRCCSCCSRHCSPCV